ncbi:TAXI family TRAP transporter solute-binding subunit [Streptomyces sp. XM4193]|uniref:TAXI family TRAP transporter solute-binding subunit n=1 Tax=Streptomyces sp. XM4193 TaxID=2929782 RepID=UPI001FF79F95|nr:TAXI family TRAP transporter solute-binding subunit [Streptomyces sp. XM4193]MCK1798004.1 TAXI family TRAP transporter solute-binding subunit [Streptomyces sp. XM4193]
MLAALGAALAAACDRQPDLDVSRLTLATGPAGATYRESGAALARVWNKALNGPVVETLFTEAGVDNSRMLRAGEVDLIFSNVDILRRHEEVAALLRIFDSVVHLVSLRGSGIRSLTDLRGRPVALGLPGSGTRFTGTRLLEAAGVEVASRDLGQQEAAQALVDGEVDAVMSLTAMPTPAISWLLEYAPPIRFIDLAAETRTLQKAHPGEYLPVTISSTVYPGVRTTSTVAVPTLIAMSRDFPADVARVLARATVEEADTLARTRPEAHQINPRTAAATAPIALHPGSADWFRSQKP